MKEKEAVERLEIRVREMIFRSGRVVFIPRFLFIF